MATDPNKPQPSGTLQAELLERSFNQIKPQASQFAASFYANLFADYPAAQPLFINTDMAKQQAKLLDSLVFVVQNLQHPEALVTALQGLGARHVQYGALPAHYPLVGNSLLKTFEQYLGADWTSETKAAWIEAYGVITKVMLEGASYSPDAVELNPTTEPI